MYELSFSHDPRLKADKEFTEYIKTLGLFGYVNCLDDPLDERSYNLLDSTRTPFRIITSDDYGVSIVPDVPSSKYTMTGLTCDILNLYMYGVRFAKDEVGLGRIKTSGINISVKRGYFKTAEQRIQWLIKQTDKALMLASKVHAYYNPVV